MAGAGGARWFAANREVSLDQLCDRTTRVYRQAVPGASALAATPARLVCIRPGENPEPVWSIEICDDRGRYAGTAIWTARTGELVSTSWRRFEKDVVQETLSPRLVDALARRYLIAMNLAEVGADWSASKSPVFNKSRWTVWCGSESGLFRVRLDRAGRFLSADRIMRS